MMWLNPVVLEISSYPSGGTTFSGDAWKRPYKFLEHSENILSKQTSEFERSDVITNLRKAIDQRIRLMNNRYSFKSIPIAKSFSDNYELLEFLGIIRPKMLKKLIDIRNLVEHEDGEPPSQEECEVFLEFAWYFLRSTDLITQRVIDGIMFEELDGENNWIEISLNPPDKIIPIIRGSIPPEYISKEPVNEWIILKIEKLKNAENTLQNLDNNNSELNSTNNFDDGINSENMYFVGELRGPDKVFKDFYKFYFNLT